MLGLGSVAAEAYSFVCRGGCARNAGTQRGYSYLTLIRSCRLSANPQAGWLMSRTRKVRKLQGHVVKYATGLMKGASGLDMPESALLVVRELTMEASAWADEIAGFRGLTDRALDAMGTCGADRTFHWLLMGRVYVLGAGRAGPMGIESVVSVDTFSTCLSAIQTLYRVMARYRRRVLREGMVDTGAEMAEPWAFEVGGVPEMLHELQQGYDVIQEAGGGVSDLWNAIALKYVWNSVETLHWTRPFDDLVRSDFPFTEATIGDRDEFCAMNAAMQARLDNMFARELLGDTV